ncbi:ubiquinol oxidase 4, chloroplastic/chromoplastic-like, partial [Durio zibethinus]|uniref:Ubiquinol oxidase n=1 Tax=Durio zibethinus TaxID=66656 RepID=A0A6P5WJ64_DURZI
EKINKKERREIKDSVTKILDTLYHDRDYARSFVLETIARVPYFAFISVLHMYESFGWWRRADYLKVHFAESWNKMQHLLIMEELEGNSWWFDRFLIQHIAIFYHIMTVYMYALSPRMTLKYIIWIFTLQWPLSLSLSLAHTCFLDSSGPSS